MSDIKQVIGLLGYPKLFGDSKSASQILPSTVKTNAHKIAKTHNSGSNPYKGMSSIVIQALMKHLFNNGLITASDIKEFVCPSSHLAYKIGSGTAVTMMTDYVNRTKKFGGNVRYYNDKYTFKGKDYALSSQLYPRCIPGFLAMALKHGLSENDVAKLCGAKASIVLKFFAEIRAGNLK